MSRKRGRDKSAEIEREKDEINFALFFSSCPFCGGDFILGRDPVGFPMTRCVQCEAKGPPARTEAEAISVFQRPRHVLKDPSDDKF